MLIKVNYEEAKLYKKELEEKNDEDSRKLREFDKLGESALGLVPDHVKEMPEWRSAKVEFDKSFAKLREFNGWFVKTFKKEIAADRKSRYKTK